MTLHSASSQTRLAGVYVHERTGSRMVVDQYRSASSGRSYPRESMVITYTYSDGTTVHATARIGDLERLLARPEWRRDAQE